MTTAVTKESLAARIAELESGPRSLKEDYTLAAFKMLRATMEAEPVVQELDEREAFEAFMEGRFGDTVDRRRAKNGDQGYMAWDMAMAWVVWEARAQPAPVAPGEMPCGGAADDYHDGWNACRAAMLNQK